MSRWDDAGLARFLDLMELLRAALLEAVDGEHLQALAERDSEG